jgi:hypothetical protein
VGAELPLKMDGKTERQTKKNIRKLAIAFFNLGNAFNKTVKISSVAVDAV